MKLEPVQINIDNYGVISISICTEPSFAQGPVRRPKHMRNSRTIFYDSKSIEPEL